VKARLLICMCGALAVFTNKGFASPWSIEPHVGASSEYASNPELRAVKPKSERHLAALFDVPVRYDGDDIQLELTPSGRYSDSSGYSSISSNYEHLDASAKHLSELGALTLQGKLARDSSLFDNGRASNGIGVRRDAASATVDWTRSVSERVQSDLQAGWFHTRYDQPPNATSLTDNRYVSLNPSLIYSANERTSFRILSGFGQYKSLDGFTESKSESLQLGFEREWTEIWSLSASAGASRSRNSYNFFFGTFQKNQNGATYSATLTRHGERITFKSSVSRALQPTGFAFLARQDRFSLDAAFQRSERLAFGVAGAWQKEREPQFGGLESDQHYFSAQLTADWHYTPDWIFSLRASRYSRTYGPPSVSSASSGISLEFHRRFLRIDL